MSDTPCQPSQQENGHFVTDPADIATETATSNPEQDTTASKREEVSQFSPHARSAEGPGEMNNPETTPDATQSADNGPPAVVTPPKPTPAEKAVSGAAMRAEWGGYPTLKEYREAQAKQATDALNQFAESWSPVIAKLDAKIDSEGPWGPFANEETRKKLEANGKKLAEKLLADAPATGTEALVCADIAKRQREGIAKYRNTVANNPLAFARWLQHMYEELLDASVYAKRILTMMNHEPENETDSDRDADGVQPASDPVVHRHRKPGAGRKAKPCPGCGAVKSIGSTVKNGIPTRRCRQCGFVVQTYPHLANVKTAE